MKRISTSKRNWQRQMEQSMRSRKKFIIVTKDGDLAMSLEKGSFKSAFFKRLLFGAGSMGAGSVIAGMSGTAQIAAGSAIFSFADPEPITKTVLALIAAACFACGCYWVYRLVTSLMGGKYKFKITTRTPFGDYEVEGEPAQ